eukprot:6559073-Pyramimonas_sp.AAC.1
MPLPEDLLRCIRPRPLGSWSGLRVHVSEPSSVRNFVSLLYLVSSRGESIPGCMFLLGPKPPSVRTGMTGAGLRLALSVGIVSASWNQVVTSSCLGAEGIPRF